jgi:hypothetical protein
MMERYVRNTTLGDWGLAGVKGLGANYPIWAFFGLNGVGAFVANNPATGQPGNQIVLGNGLTTAGNVLVHEMLHRYAGLGDIDLGVNLGGIRFDSVDGASLWLQDQLDHDCTGIK